MIGNFGSEKAERTVGCHAGRDTNFPCADVAANANMLVSHACKQLEVCKSVKVRL